MGDERKENTGRERVSYDGQSNHPGSRTANVFKMVKSIKHQNMSLGSFAAGNLLPIVQPWILHTTTCQGTAAQNEKLPLLLQTKKLLRHNIGRIARSDYSTISLLQQQKDLPIDSRISLETWRTEYSRGCIE